jgi:hypothetical protein
MRKIDVFGRKIKTTRPLYLLVVIFALSIGGFVLVTSVQNERLAQLQIEERNLQIDINNLLVQSQGQRYQEIAEMIPYLPTSFDQIVVSNELDTIKNLAGLYSATSYRLTFTGDVNNPFDEDFPSTMGFVKIDIHMNVESATKIIDYIDALYDHDRLFYVRFLEVSIDFDNSGIMDAEVYTFFNAIA